MKYLLTLTAAFLIGNSASAQLYYLNPGDPAPEFTVTDVHGQTHHLSDFAGKWVVIDFFAHWCGPCLAIAQEINDFYVKYGCNSQDIIMLSIACDGTNADVSQIDDFMGVTHPSPYVSGIEGGGIQVTNDYGVATIPTLVLIGPDGVFRNTNIGFVQSIVVQCIESAINISGGGSALVPNSCSSLGADELTIDASAVYPNPTTGDASVTVNLSNAGTVIVTVYSISGEQLSTASFNVTGGANELPVSLSDLAAGTYFVKVTNDTNTSGMIPIVKR